MSLVVTAVGSPVATYVNVTESADGPRASGPGPSASHLHQCVSAAKLSLTLASGSKTVPRPLIKSKEAGTLRRAGPLPRRAPGAQLWGTLASHPNNKGTLTTDP